MTRDEILQMEGEELAGAVAENVMGWIRGGKWWLAPDAPDALYGAGYTAPGHYDYDIPPFRPDLCVAHAWEVVKKLYNDGWIVGIGSLAQEPKGWRCELCNMWEDDFHRAPSDIEANGDTPMLAICKTALLAAMED